MTVVAPLVLLLLQTLLLASAAAAREVLPPSAYENRTMFPPLMKYDPANMPHLSFGLISDVQFAEQEEQKRRHFKLSREKLLQAVEEMNANRTHLDFVVHLGDLVDHSIERYLPVLQPILDKLRYPLYQVLGNHDFLNTDERKFARIHEMLRMPARYYSFVAGPRQRYRFVVLDGNDVALYSTVSGSPERREAEKIHARLKRLRARNANQFNGALGSTQIEWMVRELEAATAAGQRVVILLHHPMRPRGEPTNLWNDLQVVPLITVHRCVIAVINGHAHKFLYDYHHTIFRTVHFITFGGMVQSPFQTFGFVDIYEDDLHVHGLIFGRAIDNHYSLVEKVREGGTGTAVAPTGLPPITSSSVGGAVLKTVDGAVVAPPQPTSVSPRAALAAEELGAAPGYVRGGGGSGGGELLALSGDALRGPLVVMPLALLALFGVVIFRLSFARKRRW